MRFPRRIATTKLSKFILGQLGKIDEGKEWVFIVGCSNSGTTLLQDILAIHDSVSGLPVEGIRLVTELKRPEDFGWSRIWFKCLEKLQLDFGESELRKIAKRTRRQWFFWHDRKSKFLLEKSISNATRIRFFYEYFPSAKFIYIVRNGYAVAEGIRRQARPRRWNKSYPQSNYDIEDCIRQWVKSDNLISKDLEGIPHILLRYEDLCEDMEKELAHISDHLSIGKYDAKKLRDFKVKDQNFKSFQRLSEQDIKIISSLAGPTLRKYKYGTP